jgi:hypothetical protein
VVEIKWTDQGVHRRFGDIADDCLSSLLPDDAAVFVVVVVVVVVGSSSSVYLSSPTRREKVVFTVHCSPAPILRTHSKQII